MTASANCKSMSICVVSPAESVRAGSIITSLAHVSWSLCSHCRALRRLKPLKRNVTPAGMFLMFLWRFLTIGSRIVAIALFTCKFGYWIVPIAIGHWGFMTIWVLHQGTNFCDSSTTGQPRPFREYLVNFLIGAIYLFCFIPVKHSEATRVKYSVFYAIALLQNSSMALTWYYCNVTSGQVVWFQLPALVWVHGAFVSGLFFMLLYYRYFHPSGRPLRVKQPARCC